MKHELVKLVVYLLSDWMVVCLNLNFLKIRFFLPKVVCLNLNFLKIRFFLPNLFLA